MMESSQGEKRSANLKTRLSNAERFPCTAPSVNMEQHRELMDFLPKEHQYHVCRYKAVSQPGLDHISFEATLRMSLQSKEEILVWLKSMAVTWRVAYTRPTKGQKIIFKADYRCQRNTKPRETPKAGRVSKNTDCPAKLKVTLVRTEFSHGQRSRSSRSTDPHMPDYPTLVEISNVHNHDVHACDGVRRRDAGSRAAGKLAKLFEAGQSPPSALDVLKYDLQVQCTSTVAAAQELDAAEAPGGVFSSEEWHATIKEFSDLVLSSKDFQGAASALMKSFHRLKGNPSMLQAAMFLFGRCGAESLPSPPARALRRAANPARRKLKPVDRRRLAAGRPKKNVATMDHRYSFPKAEKSGAQSSTLAVQHN